MIRQYVDPPPMVRPAADLAALAREINAAHRTTLEQARRVGELLARAQDECQRQQRPWLAWLAENTGIEERSARNYMRLFREFRGEQSETVSDLGVREALDSIAAPRQAEPASASVAEAPAPGPGRVALPTAEADGEGPAAREPVAKAQPREFSGGMPRDRAEVRKGALITGRILLHDDDLALPPEPRDTEPFTEEEAITAHGRQLWFGRLLELVAWAKTSIADRTDQYLASYMEPGAPGAVTVLTADHIAAAIRALERVRCFTFGGSGVVKPLPPLEQAKELADKMTPKDRAALLRWLSEGA